MSTVRTRTPTQGGFTLVELLTAVTVMAILLAIATPSFRDVALAGQLRSSANDLLATSRLARSEAIKQNAVITLCVSPDGATCGTGGWEQGWIVLKGTEMLQRHAGLAPGLKISAASSLTTVTFQPTGLGATAATLTVCRATPSIGRQERVVTIDTSGRARVRKTTNGTCP
jgi:type IV fimbrial biogenesis protein FimT